MHLSLRLVGGQIDIGLIPGVSGIALKIFGHDALGLCIKIGAKFFPLAWIILAIRDSHGLF